MPAKVRARLRYMAGLPGFVRSHPDGERCHRLVADQLARREQIFMNMF